MYLKKGRSENSVLKDEKQQRLVIVFLGCLHCPRMEWDFQRLSLGLLAVFLGW
jgi:hypothetical protein